MRPSEIKAEQIARMVVRGIPKTRIAEEFGMTYAGLENLTLSPEYKQIEDSVRMRVTKQMDERLDRRARMEEEVEDAVPEALKVLLDHVREKRDLRAALEVLDRDPAHIFTKSARQPVDTRPPQISSEALATAIKEANWTHKLVESAQAGVLDSKPIAEA